MPNGKEGMVNVPLPEGMGPDEFMKLLESFQKSRASRTVYNTARRKAISDLVKAHKPEFEGLMTKYGA